MTERMQRIRSMWAAKFRPEREAYGKAHYIDDKGRPACTTLLAPFTCDWRPLDPERDKFHERCALCTRIVKQQEAEARIEHATGYNSPIGARRAR